MDHASLWGVCSRRLVSLRLLFGCLLLALCHFSTSSCLTAAAALTTGTRQDGAAAGGATALIRYLRSCLVLLQEELVLKSGFVLLLEL